MEIGLHPDALSLVDISRNKLAPYLTELFYNACARCSCEEQGEECVENLHFAG